MLPQFIPQERIIQLERKQKESFGKISNLIGYEKTKLEKRNEQRDWLGIFKVTLSPKMACAGTNVSAAKYQGWRQTDPEFCKMYNDALKEFVEEMQGAVVNRAMGYRVASPDGTPAVDADGRPVYEGGSDRLAVAILGLEENRRPDLTVAIEIVPRGKETKAVIEGEFYEDN